MALNLSATPPPTKPAAPKRPSAPPKADPRMRARKEAADGIFSLAQFACVLTGNLSDAGAIGEHGENISTELVKASETSEPIANVLDLMGKTGPYASLILAVLPLAMQILVNHEKLPAAFGSAIGVVSPEAMELKVKTDMLRQQRELEKERQAFEAEIQRMQQEAQPA